MKKQRDLFDKPVVVVLEVEICMCRPLGATFNPPSPFTIEKAHCGAKDCVRKRRPRSD